MDKIGRAKEGRKFDVGSTLVRRWFVVGISMVYRWFVGGSAEVRSPFGALSLGLEEGKKRVRRGQEEGMILHRIAEGMERNVRTWGRKCSQRGNKLFPAWEYFIPSVGINFSPKANFLRSLMLLLMVTFGTTVSWGQDFSGTYYIASGGKGEKNGGSGGTIYNYKPSDPTNNFYLCPTEGWCYFASTETSENDFSGDGTTYPNPFLTTYKCRSTTYHNGDASDAVWTIKKEPESGYYYIIQKSTGRYLVSNGQIRTTSNPDRIRVHLQSFSSEQLAAQGNKVLFEIVVSSNSTTTSTYIEISPKGITDETDGSSLNHDGADHTKHRWLTVNYGNYNYLKGRSGKAGGPGSTGDNYQNTSGIVCIYAKGDGNAPFCLEDYIKRPTISYDSDNKVVITPAQTGTVTIRYTLDGSTPTADHGEVYNSETPLEPALGTTIKAVTIISEGESQSVSNIATFTYIKLADSYVIQSKDCEFYNLIPNLRVGEDEYPKNLTTLNVPCSTMVWDFENAADNDGQYYYIHNSKGGYMYYTATNPSKIVYFKDSKDTSDDGYKFRIERYTGTEGGFNIIPKVQTGERLPINKSSIIPNGNAKLDAVKLTGTVDDATSRWALIPYSAETPRTSLPQWRDAPFAESDGEHTYYYRINSVRYPTMPLILDNDGDIKSTTLPTSGYDNRKSVWVIKWVGTDTDGLLDYYTFQNANTGELLYLNKKEKKVMTDTSPGMLQMGQPTVDGADETWSHFVIVQTINNGYNIIPRVLVDNTKAISSDTTDEGYNCINRANGKVYTGTWHDNDDGSRWTFEQKTDVKCMNPTFAEDTGNITISCVTNAAVIHYTTNGEEPTASSGVYSAPIESASEKICIKAIAIVGDGTDDYSKSEIITLMNMPDITLKEGTTIVDDNTYIYDGTAKEPAVTVSIGDVVAPTNTYTIDYTNNTNAGTETSIPTVTVTDVDDDLWIINTAPKAFVINPRNLTLTWTNTELEYTGTEQKPTLTVGNIVESETLTITVSIVEDGGGINMGTYTATATIEPNSNYVLPTDVPLTTSYTINPKILGDGTDPAPDISIDFTYDGSDYNIIVKQGSTTLTEGESNDYTMTGSSSANGKYYIVTVTGHNNYKDGFTAKYALVKFDHKAAGHEFSGTFVSDAGDGETAGDGDFGVPDGMNVYIITSIRPAVGQVVAVKVDYIPEGVPVLLLYDDEPDASPANGFFVKPKDDAIAAVSTNNNLLRATTAETHFDTAKIYLLYKGEFVLNLDGDLAAGKIYLDNTTGGAHARLAIVWEEPSDIDIPHPSTLNLQPEGTWYTLDGRRINGKPTKKGLYLMNGQKIIVKN